MSIPAKRNQLREVDLERELAGLCYDCDNKVAVPGEMYCPDCGGSGTTSRMRAMQAMRDQGFSVAQVAEHFSVTPKTVYRVLMLGRYEGERETAGTACPRCGERSRPAGPLCIACAAR